MTDSVNEQHRFAPHDIAGMFDVSVMTVRRWAEYHKAHLSESANPSPGKPRSFTWADVETFRQIKAWRDAGLSVDAINTRLTGSITEPIIPTVTGDSAVASVGAQEGLQQAQGVMVALEAMRTEIAAIRAVASEAKQVQRDAITWFAMGFIAAGIFFLIIVVMAWLYGGG